MTTPTPRLAGLTRFGQVNFTEADVSQASVGYWKDIWQRAKLEAVLLNCGGIMAYHPTALDGHPVARGVEQRDFFGEMVSAARELGIAVVGRLDVGVVDQRFADLHPQWLMTGQDGARLTLNGVTGGAWGKVGGPRIENEMYYTCINSGLFEDYLPKLLSEVATNYDVAGFFTNGFPTVALASPSVRMRCWCERCLTLWRDASGFETLPERDDPNDPKFRAYVGFLRSTSLRQLRALVRHTQSLGPGLSFNTSAIPTLGGGLPWNEWVDELAVLFCDNQDRSPDYGRAAPSHGLWEVGLSSELLRSVAQRKQAMRVQSTARMRHGGRHSSKNPAEMRLQMAQALQHGELPMWHAVSAVQPSRRWVDGVIEFDRWMASDCPDLIGRASVADVGIVWSQESTWLQDWDDAPAGPVFGHSLAGWHLAMLRERIPAHLVLADGCEGFEDLKVLVLPSGLALSAQAVERVLAFVDAGGALVVCGNAGALDPWGNPHAGDPIARAGGISRDVSNPDGPVVSAYLQVDPAPFWMKQGPDRNEDVVSAGSWRTPFVADADVRTALEWLPSEFVIPTHAAALPAGSGADTVAWNEIGPRIAYVGTDLDARFFRHRLPEHRELLAGLAKWALGPNTPTVSVRGDGVVDVRSWRAGDNLLVMVTNIDNHGAHEEAVESFRPVGPLTVRVRGRAVGALIRRNGSQAVAVRHPAPDVSEFDLETVVDFTIAQVSFLPGNDQ